MEIGVVFPQTEIGDNPEAVREFAQAAEDLGFSHIMAFDHVVGASRDSRPSWRGPYDLDSMFHEPFVLFGYLAGVTSKIGFATGVIILAQRQTVLVAKQAAAVDVISAGRLRLGVGIGWNAVEYEALSENFHDRGIRSADQVMLMRQLWTNRAVTYKSKWHSVTDAGIYPLPVQRPIPVWFGGGSEKVLRRTGNIGDGWMPNAGPTRETQDAMGRIRDYACEAGRNPDNIGLDGRVSLKGEDSSAWVEGVERWRDLGATHLSVGTMGDGLYGPTDHIKRIEQFQQIVNI